MTSSRARPSTASTSPARPRACGSSSPDSDVARLECSLDGGAFATCTSPKAFTGLTAGAHSVAVRAVDNAGNVGDAASRGFSIAAPPSTGGGGTHDPGRRRDDPAAGRRWDDRRQTVRASLLQRSVRASKGGVVKLRLKCLRGEKRCTITLRLKRGGKVVAVKTARIDFGATRTVSLRLSKSTRRALAQGQRQAQRDARRPRHRRQRQVHDAEPDGQGTALTVRGQAGAPAGPPALGVRGGRSCAGPRRAGRAVRAVLRRAAAAPEQRARWCCVRAGLSL